MTPARSLVRGARSVAHLATALLGAVRPARAPDRDTPQPRQARRYLGDQARDVLVRDYPHWRIFTIPDKTGPQVWITAAYGSHLIRTESAEKARKRIEDIENAPPLNPVRPYLDWEPDTDTRGPAQALVEAPPTHWRLSSWPITATVPPAPTAP